MNTTVKKEYKNGVPILVLLGKMMDEGQIRQKIKEIIGEHHKKVIFDLSQTTLINEYGLGAIIGAREFLEIKIVGLQKSSQQVQDKLRITHACLLFESFDTIESALDSFKQKSN